MLSHLLESYNAALPKDLLEHTWQDSDYDGEYLQMPAQAASERFYNLGIAALGGVISAERLAVADSIFASLGKLIRRLCENELLKAPSREADVRKVGFAVL